MKALLHLNKYFLRYKWRLLVGFLFVTVSVIFRVFPAQLVRQSFDVVEIAIEEYKSGAISDLAILRSKLLWLGLAIIGSALLSAVFMFFMRQTVIVVSRYIEYDLKNEIFDHYQKLSLSFYRKNSTGDLMNRISEDVTMVRMYVGPAIMYAVAAGVSVGSLFLAGVLPALVLTAILCAFVFVDARRNPLREEAATSQVPLMTAITSAIPVLFTPVIILGGILGGVFTPTEAAAAAVMWVLLLSVCYRSLSLAALRGVLVKTASTTGTIMLIVSAAGLFGWVIAREQGPQAVTQAMLSLTDNPYVFLLLINVALLVTGMLLEPVAGLLITVPVLLPAALEFGIDPLQLGIIMILNLVLGLLTPPVGLVLYVLSSVTGASVQTVIRGTVPFLIPLLITLLLITFVPAFSLWLPSLLVK